MLNADHNNLYTLVFRLSYFTKEVCYVTQTIVLRTTDELRTPAVDRKGFCCAFILALEYSNEPGVDSGKPSQI